MLYNFFSVSMPCPIKRSDPFTAMPFLPFPVKFRYKSIKRWYGRGDKNGTDM